MSEESEILEDQESLESLDEIQDAPELIREKYLQEGVPDFWEFKVKQDNPFLDSMETENDYWLAENPPTPFFGLSIENVSRHFKEYPLVSGYTPSKIEYTELVERLRPTPAETVGGKGLTMYTHPVVYLTAGMSRMVNINIGFGCPARCIFCKEANVARSYSELRVEEDTGVLEFSFEGRKVQVEGMVRVKFWDPINEVMIYGPLQVALSEGFPISLYSLRRLVNRKTFRVLSD